MTQIGSHVDLRGSRYYVVNRFTGTAQHDNNPLDRCAVRFKRGALFHGGDDTATLLFDPEDPRG